MTGLLAKLDHPEDKLPPVIHVAGTNGKGSTVACLRAILEAAGLRVHVYSSPHLVRFSERIRLGGQLIDEGRMLDYLTDCENINGDTPITYFEITTALAFMAFAHSPADVLLLEVGLGGRLDATNVIDLPLSTVITPISVDHQDFLGADPEIIAGEKAGIAKAGVPLVTAPQSPPVMAVLRDHARRIGAELIDDWSVEPTPTGFDYCDRHGRLSCPRPGLDGPHQITNAGLAIASLRHQDRFSITPDHIRHGIAAVTWPARLQNITASAYGDILPAGSDLWLDGGHNPAAGQILADYFDRPDPRPLYLICAMMTGKDVAGFLAPLSHRVRGLFAVTIPGENSYSAAEIADRAQRVTMTAGCCISAKKALRDIQTLTGETAVRVLICGSLYLAGHILAQNDLVPD
ncbi:MAG: bifunctional folylpolyglutamate synthase/dihydrofolate synthase [Alphaproteobacteria bacterium]|nr:bifunctional folylpolyglutamate synthase/dihydrofolate synthase [Alphaproteobacteria bacterium]